MSRTIAATLTATLTAVTLVALSSSAEAGGCGGGFGGGYSGGYHRPVYSPIYRPIYPRPIVVHRPVVVPQPIVVPKPIVVPVADHCRHPQHCYAWVAPGETLDTICLREYGDASLWPQVAKYNGLTDVLPTDRPLQLPAIFDSGRMIPSTAPAPAQPLAEASDAIPAA